VYIEKLTTRLQNKTWTNPQSKNLKRAMNSDLSAHRHDTKSITHVFKFLTPSVENTVNLHGMKLHLKTKKYKM